jgi:hypothetical protein
MKKRRKIKQKKPRILLIVRFKFGDTSEVTVPLAEVTRQLLDQYGAMANSDDPRLRAIGRQRLKGVTEQIAARMTDQFVRAKANRNNATKPRPNRTASAKTELQIRGLQCLLRQCPGITAERLREMLDAEPLTLDDDDIELSLDGGNIVVRNLKARAAVKSATITKTSLRTYLARARVTTNDR